jgi:hypothetical protein
MGAAGVDIDEAGVCIAGGVGVGCRGIWINLLRRRAEVVFAVARGCVVLLIVNVWRFLVLRFVILAGSIKGVGRLLVVEVVVRMLPMVLAVDVVSCLGRFGIISRFCLLGTVLALWRGIFVVAASEGVSIFVVVVLLLKFLLLMFVVVIVVGFGRNALRCVVVFIGVSVSLFVGDAVSRFLIIAVLLSLVLVLMFVRRLKGFCFMLFDFVLLDFVLVLAGVSASKFFVVIVLGVSVLKFVVVVLSMLVVLMLMFVWKFGLVVWLDCVLLFELNLIEVSMEMDVLVLVLMAGKCRP